MMCKKKTQISSISSKSENAGFVEQSLEKRQKTKFRFFQKKNIYISDFGKSTKNNVFSKNRHKMT